MKLKCDNHNRRVMSTTQGFLHRTDDCSPCDSETATMDNPRGGPWNKPQARTYAIDLVGGLHLAFIDGQPVLDLTRV